MPRGNRVDLYVCKESFYTENDGQPESVRKGDLVRAGHPILRRHMSLFDPIDKHIRFDVEAATAAPGQLR